MIYSLLNSSQIDRILFGFNKLNRKRLIMNNSKTISNPWMIPVTLGVSSVAGFLLGKLLGQRKLSAEQILNMVVTDFKNEGPVAGSWIDHHVQPFQRFAFKTDVYRGGIQRQEDDQLVSYMFLADAYTGSVIQIKRVQN